MITPNLMKLIGDAMKAHNTIRVSTLRMLLSELKNEKINLQHELTDEDELKVIRRESKKRKEAIEMYAKANANDKQSLASAAGKLENEKAELAILSEFLPAEVTEEEVNQLINDSIVKLGAKDISMMGKVITDVKSKNSGVDGGVVANIVRSKLSNG